MAYPVVESVTASQWASNAEDNAASMPATVSAGDLLLIFVAFYQNEVPTTPSGWSVVSSLAGIRYIIYGKVAEGDEGGTTVTIATSGGANGACQTYRISGWGGTLADDVDVGTFASGSGSANPNPPSVTAGWGSAENLFIAYCGGNDDDATVNAAPTNYSNLVSTVSGAGTNAGAEVGTATRELESDTDDPGTFTFSQTEDWGAQTVVVKPASAGGVSVAVIMHHMNMMR